MTATDASPEVFSGPLGEQLHRRLQDATAQARELLGFQSDSNGTDDGDAFDLEALRTLIAGLREQLPEVDA